MLKNLNLRLNKYITNSSETLAKAIFFGRRETIGSRVMDAKAQAIGGYLQKLSAGAPMPTAAQSRLQMLAGAALFDEPCPDILRKENLTITGAQGALNARLYSDVPCTESNQPILLFFHGGGWMQGDLDTHDGICGKLAKWGNCIIVAIDYSLAPEHKFPAGVNDALAAYEWARENATLWGGDPNRIGVCGDSAGGNLAAIICQQITLQGGTPPFLQVLIYPSLDATLSSKSAAELQNAYILSRPRLDYFFGQYTNNAQDLSDIRLSPLNNKSLSGQPKSYIVTAGFDPLRDEGAAYAKQLKQCGVIVEYREYSGQIHAFTNFCKIIPQANICIREISHWLKSNW